MKNRNHLKGLHTPRPFVFIHGFLNGRCKTAALDQESKLLNSAYIHGKCCLFSELCREQVIQLETELAEARTDAQKLLLKLRALPMPPLPEGDDAETAHAKAKCDRIAANRAEIIGHLIEIRDEIATRERVCCEGLTATAEALKERFAVYGHGVLLKPVCSSYIPDVSYESALEGYRADHDALRQKIDNVLKEEGLYNV
jgi:hypothetical protein